MSELSQGLRFDVYERVHLPEDVPAINELEEIELVPRIQVIQQGEQAILRGQLLLSGQYRTEDRSEPAQTMEHRIPVEITLPMNRIERLDDISVEIDNFDVDLLSSRTLNITGVLSLTGIRVESSAEEEGEWKEEPYTVIHRQEAQATGDISPPVRYLELDDEEAGEEQVRTDEGSPNAAEFYRDQSYDAVEEAQNEPYAYAAGWTKLGAPSDAIDAQTAQGLRQDEDDVRLTAGADAGESSPAPEDPASRTAARDEGSAYSEVRREERQSAFSSLRSISGEPPAPSQPLVFQEDEEPSAVLYGRPSAELPETGVADAIVRNEALDSYSPDLQAAPGADFASAFAAESLEAHEPLQEQEKQELRIAFGSKRSAAPEADGQELASLIGSSRREREQRQEAERSRQAQEARAVSYGEEVEWQSLFLSRASEENPFRKVRMCIVQREETLDLIADRYHLQPREIALYNRLADQGVAEGQVLYIP